ncbi:uncharacterized protein [Vicugna pacos]|uniref:Uncharacterized protein n=1 Tax=Vicugna pacos TaxID=30538 RepID=A0ABM5CGL8_VICPA
MVRGQLFDVGGAPATWYFGEGSSCVVWRLKRLQRRQRSPSGKRGADRAAAAELRAECGGGSGAAPRWFAGGSALGLSRAAAAAAAALFLWEARRGPSGGRPAANMAVVDAAPCDGPRAAVRRRRRSSNLVLRRGLQLRGVVESQKSQQSGITVGQSLDQSMEEEEEADDHLEHLEEIQARIHSYYYAKYDRFLRGEAQEPHPPPPPTLPRTPDRSRVLARHHRQWAAQHTHTRWRSSCSR